MLKLVSSKEMKEIEQKTFALGARSIDVMEKAAEAIADFVKIRFDKDKKICAVCGKGNNGGDGYVIARKLTENFSDIKIIKDFGKIDILVNNAGIMDEMMPVGEVEDELWENVMNVNLNGPFYACRKAVNLMINQGGGIIINIGSIGGLNGGRAGASYTTSKYALLGLSKNIGFMYADKGIRCNVICPGGVDSEIGVGISHPSAFGFSRVRLGMSNIPRSGSPDEIATIALFLACDDSSLINGTEIVADAGWTSF